MMPSPGELIVIDEKRRHPYCSRIGFRAILLLDPVAVSIPSPMGVVSSEPEEERLVFRAIW